MVALPVLLPFNVASLPLVRSHIEPTSAYHLNADEGGIIDKYRALTPKERACVAQVIDTLLEK